MQNAFKRLRALLVVGLVGMMPALALAQGDARFAGTVLDQTGAFVPGAAVTVKNEKTGETRTVTSTQQGRYVVPNLKPSTYTITVKFGDFQPLEYTDMPLAAGQEFSLDLELHPAGVSETVTVSAEARTVDLSSARIGANVSEREVAALPVNGRQMSQLLLQAPGSQNAGTGTWNDVRFSGRAVEQNVIKFDGVEGSAIIDASPGNIAGQIASPFKLQASLENVQEFRVESSNYPAEFGTGTGGQVSVVTKSGANRFKGSVFEYYRNDRFDSKNYFDDLRNADGTIQSAGHFFNLVPYDLYRGHEATIPGASNMLRVAAFEPVGAADARVARDKVGVIRFEVDGATAMVPFTAEVFERLLAEEYAKLQIGRAHV